MTQGKYSKMKKIFATTLLLFSVNSFAEWTLFTGSDGVDVYLDISTLKKVEKNLRVWTLYSFSSPKTLKVADKVHQSIMSYQEVDCVQEKSRNLALQFFKEKMGEGGVVYSTNDAGEWSYHAPNSIGHLMIKVVCAK